MGIYLDQNTGMVEVSGNTVAHCTMGIFLQDAHEVVVKDNTLYDNGAQLSIRHAQARGALRNNDISGNTAVAAKKEESVLVLSSAVSGEVAWFAASMTIIMWKRVVGHSIRPWCGRTIRI